MITFRPHNYALCIMHFALTITLLTACSNIGENERYIYVPPTETTHNVLIEDFTGQRCVNCPAATQKIKELEAEYGDRIIAVAIHCGPFAHRSTMSSPLLPLGTETGDEYYRHWNIEAQPAVAVNRLGTMIYNTNMYATAVRTCIAMTTTLNLDATCKYDEGSRKLDVTIDANTAQTITGKLEVWLVEDNITETQLMPDGSANQNYVHNHVFRKSITNDIFGDPITVNSNKAATTTYSTTLDSSWKRENLSVVAFISDNTGVVQVIKSSL